MTWAGRPGASRRLSAKERRDYGKNAEQVSGNCCYGVAMADVYRLPDGRKPWPRPAARTGKPRLSASLSSPSVQPDPVFEGLLSAYHQPSG